MLCLLRYFQSPKVPDIVSSRQWPDLLRRLHEILPEKQIIRLTSPTDGGEALLVARRHPCQPIYYDHLVLRMVPVLEIILTSFLDNPPPLHQLARFCDTVAPLFRFHCEFLNKNETEVFGISSDKMCRDDISRTVDILDVSVVVDLMRVPVLTAKGLCINP